MRGFLHISCNNTAIFVRASMLSLFISQCLKRRTIYQAEYHVSLEFQGASGSCERIRSIRGTRLLPPDIEREFTSTRRPSASELILTCHSVMAYARSPLHVFPLASGSTFRRLSKPSPAQVSFVPPPSEYSSPIYQESSLFRRFTCRFDHPKHILDMSHFDTRKFLTQDVLPKANF